MSHFGLKTPLKIYINAPYVHTVNLSSLYSLLTMIRANKPLTPDPLPGEEHQLYERSIGSTGSAERERSQEFSRSSLVVIKSELWHMEFHQNIDRRKEDIIFSFCC
jgi:hypothetical protein